MDLKQDFPISRRHALKVGFLWLCAGVCFFLLLLAQLVFDNSSHFENAVPLIPQLLATSVIGCFLVSAGRILFDAAMRLSTNYTINADILSISRGLVRRTSCSFPLSRITEVYLRQDLLDLVFGLCTIQIDTSTPAAQHFGQINGLRMKTAEAMRSMLLELSKNNIANGTATRAPSSTTSSQPGQKYAVVRDALPQFENHLPA